MSQFKNKEEYEKWKAERGKVPSAESKPAVTAVPQPKSADKKCPHCAMDIPSTARICPFCRKEQMTSVKALITVIGFAAAALLIIGSQCSNGKPAPSAAVKEYEAHGEIEACVYSQLMVKNLLSAPATADFGPCNSIKKDAGYSIASYVDSDNSFGAKLRTPYAWDGRWYNKEWRTDFLALGSKTYIADGKIVSE